MEVQKAKLIKCDVTIDPDGIRYPRLHIQYIIQDENGDKLCDIPEAILPLRPDIFAIETIDMSSFTPASGHWLMLTDDKCYMNQAKGELSEDREYALAEKDLSKELEV